ncbi:unnamed protein product [Hydatigera taeniaeformis]|uniref:Myosin_tail_1 domain-containing protein n=1 Tax=Hydatigena taeniaeformis TaxID=6205 RepID=A0A158RDC9_HYDTA|nr:unnamed protein product [Hydatigera taeniaeformis]
MFYNLNLKTQSGGFPDREPDLDDLLDGIDFNEKGSSKTGTAAASSTLETSFDSLKLSAEAKPLGVSSLNESSNTSSTINSAVRGVQKKSGATATSSSRRSLLDSLLNPEDTDTMAGGTEVNLDSSFEVKAAPTAATSRRSVRFSEKPQGDNAPDLTSVSEKTKRDGDVDVNDKAIISRPRTAPSERDKSGMGWGDLEGDLDWFSKDHNVGSGRGSGEFKGGMQKTTCNISIEGGLDLDATLTEKKAVSGGRTNPTEERSILVGGGKGNSVRRSINFRGSKERSPSWEPQRSPSFLVLFLFCSIGKMKVATQISCLIHFTKHRQTVQPGRYRILSGVYAQDVQVTINDAATDGSETAPKLRQLQAEVEALRGLLKMTKDYHREEIKLLEQSHSSKMKLLEENSLRREKHLQEELDFTVSQCKLRIGQLESFQETARADFADTMAAARDDALKAVASLRNEHTLELEALTERHAKALTSLREANATEARVLTEMQPAAEALQALLGQLLLATKEVQQAEVEHQTAVAQRLVKLERREELIRQAEERLWDRERESDKTHKLLTEAVGKMEVQLREQSKLLEDDRWTLKQEQARLTKIQVTLEEDRRAQVEQAGRERIELQQLITNFFDEHRESQSRLSAERNAIAEEQQKFRVDQLCWRRRQEEEEKKLTCVSHLNEEMTRTKESLQIEKHALEERMHQLKLNEVKLTETQHHLDIVRSNLQGKEVCLNEREAELDRRQEELSNRASTLSGTQAAVAEIDAKCRRLLEEQARAQAELQSRKQEIEDMEKRLTKDNEFLEDERIFLSVLRHAPYTQ